VSYHTVIPDIHADFERLDLSLKQSSDQGKILFLGDFIDAGSGVSSPSDVQVLNTVKTLIEGNEAIGVMGNHELNAILFHAFNDRGPLRAHSDKNKKQHKSFIEAFGVGTASAREWTDWFLSALPLWREFEGLRLVHACWSEQQISVVRKRRPDGYLKRDDLEEISTESTDFGKAVKILTSGPEVVLPEPYSFEDYQGNTRREVRIAWWSSGASTWQDATLSVPNPDQLPSSKVPSEVSSEIYSADGQPVLVGHYKMKGEPVIDNNKAASLDYPFAPCIYKWSGEAFLSQDNLIKVL